MKAYYVYILSNKHRTVFYTGITNNLIRRVNEHVLEVGSKFCRRYNICELVYYEEHCISVHAINREKIIKKLSKKNKLKLIYRINPENIDLFKRFGSI